MDKKTIILITGGNAGIGYETVKLLSSTHPDTHHILLSARTLAKAESAIASLGSPSNISPLELDITSDTSISAAVQAITTTYTRLDTLIHNAGTAGLDLPTSTSLREKFQTVYNVNAISPFVLTSALEDLLDRSPLPKVIFVSSSLGSIAWLQAGYAFPRSEWYASSKAALNHVAAYWARRKPGWKANAVCPGLNATGLNGLGMTEELHPRHGAGMVCGVVDEGFASWSGRFEGREGKVPW
ncbi:NAD(P)-binding protein [Myriangium duriaei CBS 260.36]|uniref:NAD(P)-binding protein n=1 Tax=Myriangium duriaei CBS 260.36 TaxID=1168546 RepID=A0A9P4J850_9PEZI|nr:NAD(P)-binding protein [Myriangium duriaei CBS 260.36]